MLFAIASSLCAAASASLLPSSGPRLRSLSPRVRAAPLMQVAGAELTLERWLSDCGASESLSEVVLALGGACMDVAERVRTASCDSYSCFNEHHSDERMSGVAIDLVAEQLMVDALRGTGCVAAVSTPLDPLGCLDPAGQYSEDVDLVQQRQRRERLSGSVPAAVPADLGVLSASVDPLHGSSIIDTNFAVGSLFGVWRAPSLLNVTGESLLAAGACIYGPRTTLAVALAGSGGVAEFLLVPGDRAGGGGARWLLANRYTSLGEGALFAPGNLRAVTEHPGYASLIAYWHENRYQLRYTGGMVSDVMQLIVKGKGVFSMPAAPGRPPPARLLHEALPLAFLAEKCGGASSDGRSSLLRVPVERLDQRTQLAVGSAKEVARFDEMVGPAALAVETE